MGKLNRDTLVESRCGNNYESSDFYGGNKLKFKDVVFYYFSGTGNTQLIVKKMCDTFHELGVDVSAFKINETDPEKVDVSKIIGLAFPIAAQASYKFILEFIEKLPESNGTKVFMVDTLAGFSGAIIGPLRKILNNKGYETIGAHEIIMPNNFCLKKINENADRIKIERGLSSARKYAIDLVEGRTSWGRIPFFPDLMYRITASKYPWEFLRKMIPIELEKEKCTSCGLCVKLCPVGNITLEDGIVFSDKCQLCMRCFSYCPTEAIGFKNKQYLRYKAVKKLQLN